MSELQSVGGGLGKARGNVAKGASGATKAGSVAKKAQLRGGALLVRALLLVLLGLLLATFSLIDPFGPTSIHVPRMMLFGTGLASLLIGIWVVPRPVELSELWPALGTAGLSALAVFAGLALGHLFLPRLFSIGSSAFAWLIASAAIMVLLPTLTVLTFQAAIGIAPKRYELWHYPKNYREQQHTWNRDRIVIANFHFKRKEQEDLLTTVNVKLPEDAELGELIYLFIKDYNENRFPNAPITNLRSDDGDLGWLFRKPRYVFRKQRKWAYAHDFLDPKLTIAQNRITRDSDVFFERVHSDNGVT